MALINLKKKEVECKIVYYGPGRCGKTTNLEYVFKNSRKLMTNDMVSIKTKGDMTIFFDFVPMEAGRIIYGQNYFYFGWVVIILPINNFA